MIASIRGRVADLVETLSQLDSLLETGDPGRLPGLTLARTAIAVDSAAMRLAKLAEQLAADSQPKALGKAHKRP